MIQQDTLPRREPVQSYARIIGVLLLISMLAGGFGEVYVPSQLIVSADAGATAKNLQDSDLLFRFGFASYLVEAVCDVTLTLLFYLLLRPVRNDLALLSAFFGLVSTAVFGASELFYFISTLALRNAEYLKAFSLDQRNVLALLSLRAYGVGGGVFMVFYGVASLLRGYLVFRSGYLPKLLGAILALAGLGFVAKNFLLVLAPAYSSDVLLLPMPLAAVSLAAWLLARGVDVPAHGTRK